MPKPCTVREVAEMFHVSTKTIVRWCEDGKLPHSETLGGHRRFDREAMLQLASEHGYTNGSSPSPNGA